jgi:hypothetical protein
LILLLESASHDCILDFLQELASVRSSCFECTLIELIKSINASSEGLMVSFNLIKKYFFIITSEKKLK